MIDFDSVDELLAYLQDERRKGERFATRFILVQGREAWCELISKLIGEVDRVVRLSQFCSGKDVFPDMMRLQAYLRDEASGDCRFLLIPLAECLRLDLKNASEMLRSIAEWPTGKVRRLYVPLLEVEDIFSSEMKRVMRYGQNLLPDVWRLRGEGGFEITIAPFITEHTDQPVIEGIKAYLSLWEESSVSKAWVSTALAPWLSVKQTWGNCRVNIYRSCFEYIKAKTACNELVQEWGSSDDWVWLVSFYREGDTLDKTASRILNVAHYDAQQLFSLWPRLDERKRWLVWLWSKLRSKSGTYLGFVMQNSSNLYDFSRYDAVMTIFDLPRSSSFSRERKELLACLGVSAMPPEFWERYRSPMDLLDRLAVLTDLTSEEQGEIVSCVGEMLSEYSPDLWWSYLEVAFPALSGYLQLPFIEDEFVCAYFSAYLRCRLKDKLDEALSSLVAQWKAEKLLWSYPTRNKILTELRAAGAKVLWVDAMGVEWAGLLTQLLTEEDQVECEVKIVRANLPTTTAANKDWDEDKEEVMRGLDNIAHHYEYKFPKSYLDAMGVIKDVSKQVSALLSQVSTVVVVSDHGLSRFAATSDAKIEAPEKAEVGPYGRYATLQNNDQAKEIDIDDEWIREENYICLLGHNRFRHGGGSSGEVHGGAAPEECLIPAIIARRREGKVVQLQFEVVTTTVKLNPKGEGRLDVWCNRKIDGLELRVSGHQLLGQKGDDRHTWSFSLKNWKAGRHDCKLYSANRSVGEISFEATKGISEEDLGL